MLTVKHSEGFSASDDAVNFRKCSIFNFSTPSPYFSLTARDLRSFWKGRLICADRKCPCFSGAVCPSGPVPLSRLSVVSAGQEGQRGRLLVRPGHRASIQQAG